jgi:Stage II sporulation protein E (SpoIIE)
VAGHGPNEAALGAALRIAWRTLTFTGFDGADRMRQLERVLRAERAEQGVFATVLSITIPPMPPDSSDCPPITVVRAGHPGMLLHCTDTVDWIEPPFGPALGLNADDWPQHQVEFPAGHGLLLLTDGLFEGYSGRGNERLGEDGLLELARRHVALPGPEFVDALIDGAQERAQGQGGLTDDIAVVRVERTSR